jgi:hypothetical protein
VFVTTLCFTKTKREGKSPSKLLAADSVEVLDLGLGVSKRTNMNFSDHLWDDFAAVGCHGGSVLLHFHMTNRI